MNGPLSRCALPLGAIAALALLMLAPGDGHKPGSPVCSNSEAAQDLGPSGADGKPLGRNGILVWKADNSWVENMTVCNFLNGAGSAGNEIWWNGGDGTGVIGEHGYWGN